MTEFKNILYSIALTDISLKVAPYVVTLPKSSMPRSTSYMFYAVNRAL